VSAANDAPRAVLTIPGRPRPWIMAHRGASDHAPENSAASFRLAVEQRADLVETDLWCLADGEIACHHDPMLTRMTGDRRRIVDVDAAALRKLRLRAHIDGSCADERVPCLDELLAIVPDDVAVVLELKDRRFAEPARLRRLVDRLGARARERRAAVIAFDLDLLLQVRAVAPGIVTGHIALTDPFGTRHTDMLGPWWPWPLLNPRYVNAAHARRQRVCPLDPHLHRRLHRWLELDVDAVLTNDPAGTRALLDQLRRST
jgi:glycerophosphoryl diester phosphodiesterase